MQGLSKRNGIWHVRHAINGVRIQKSTHETDYEKAATVARRIIDAAKADLRSQNEVSSWSEYVDAEAAYSEGWVRVMFKGVKARQLDRGRKNKDAKTGITLDYLVQLLKNTGGRCQVSDLPFDFKPVGGSKQSPWQPSVDRIDSSRGYEPGNVRIVCLAVNVAMREWGVEVMSTIGKAMLRKELNDGFGDLNQERWCRRGAVRTN